MTKSWDTPAGADLSAGTVCARGAVKASQSASVAIVQQVVAQEPVRDARGDGYAAGREPENAQMNV